MDQEKTLEITDSKILSEEKIEAVKDFEHLIAFLQSLGSTEEILLALFNYFKNSVTYNYDELQVVKFKKENNSKFEEIRELLLQNRNTDSLMLKETIIKLLDDVFLEIEGRPLTEMNKRKWFENYGKVIHHEAREARNGTFKILERTAFDEIIHLEVNSYLPVYENGLLKDGYVLVM